MGAAGGVPENTDAAVAEARAYVRQVTMATSQTMSVRYMPWRSMVKKY